jgi:GntR family transcriptional regulator of arabinose operon
MGLNNFDGPKYQMVKTHIKHLLKNGIIPYGKKLPSEHELMEEFQVSRHTIRQAFGELAGEGLIYKEQGKGTFSNYLKANRPKQIVAVITPYISSFAFPKLISGIEEVLSDEDYMMLLANTNNLKEREAQHLKSVLEQGVIGIIIEPTQSGKENVNLALLNQIEAKGIKTVCVNAVYDDFNSAYVLLDDEKGGYMVTEYLLQLGHRKIAGIFNNYTKISIKRKAGFLKAIHDYNGVEDLRLVGNFETSDMYVYPYMFTQSVLREKDHPTAFVCYNDQIAMMVMQAVLDQGLRIPEDISVVGYDDSIEAMSFGVKLTTVVHPKKTMGIQAAKFLINMLDGRMQKPQMIYQPELIVRNSCRSI